MHPTFASIALSGKDAENRAPGFAKISTAKEVGYLADGAPPRQTCDESETIRGVSGCAKIMKHILEKRITIGHCPGMK
jgi:hypothetical protein